MLPQAQTGRVFPRIHNAPPRAGIPQESSNLTAREIDARDMPLAQLVLGQLRGRALSVAASKFVDQISSSLHSRYGER